MLPSVAVGGKVRDRQIVAPTGEVAPISPLAERPRGALDMLERSHRRLEQRLADLIMAAEAVAQGEPGDHLAAIDEVLEFLERSATRHEVDEEGSLFPRLRRHLALSPLLETLTSEHARHHRLHGELRDLRRRLGPGRLDPTDGARLADLAGQLDRAYRLHIEREEAELLPAARAHLSADELSAMLDEMDERRERDRADPGKSGGGRDRRRSMGGHRVRLR